MERKKNKYDTNPLDPDLERKAEDDWGSVRLSPETQPVRGATNDVKASAKQDARQNVYSEAPTRRYDGASVEGPYPSVFIPPAYSPPTQTTHSRYPQPEIRTPPTSRTVPGFGLSEKWAVVLPYAPFYVGLVASLLELFLVPRRETKVRFHASQGLALHIALLIVQTIFGVISTVSGSSIGGVFFKLAAFVFLIISMIRVCKGAPHNITPLAEPAQWFNQHIEPRIHR